MKIIGAQILGPDFQFRQQTLEIAGDTIVALSDATSQEASCDVALYDGLKLIPGLIDVHMHGYRGKSCSSANPDDLVAIAENLVKEGVTGFASGISTTADDTAMTAIASARCAADRLAAETACGAALLGIHMEGPFLNPEKKGAMEERYIQQPKAELLQRYRQAGGDLIRIMTLAPEMPGAEEVVRYGVAQGMKISMGHTMATHAQAQEAVSWGVSRLTHTFNAARPLNHRESGVLGVALLDENVQCELIGDLVHVAPEMCFMVYRLKGAKHITLISDSCALAGLKQEELPKHCPVTIQDAAYLPGGTLCGSIGNVMTMVRNMVKIGIPLEDAVQMASLSPARDLGLEKELGSLAPGKKASFVLIDENLAVHAVYVNGRLVYRKG